METSAQIQQSKTTHQASDDPDYLAWKDAKVSKALKEAREKPERRVPQSEVWKKFDLES